MAGPHHKAAATVSVIDTSTGVVVGLPVSVGNFPFAVAVTPDGHHAYVTSVQPGKVSVIDTSTGKVTGTALSLDMGVSVDRVAVSHGHHAYVTVSSGGALAVLDL
ncbi:YncE family protein [Streptomyces sp. NPDC085929]|uniref:YncE family protein n=1 Tax=Streptomyces sp. NPDC085929 TaxID=3365739 RepID=UPI0037D774D2